MDLDSWQVGNAVVDSKDRRGWLVGHFLEDGGLRRTTDVEIKWGVHLRGDERAEWQADEYRTTVLLLIRGRFQISSSVASHTLVSEGDYAMWGPGIDHSWLAEEDSVVVTIRWPSTPSK